MSPVELTAFGMAACSAVCAAGSIAMSRDSFLDDRMPTLPASAEAFSKGHDGSLLRRAAAMPVLVRFASRGDLPDRIRRAGWTQTPPEVVALQVALAGIGVVLPLALGAVLLSPLLGALGLRAPRIALARAERRRAARIDAELPQLLDVLAATSHAGLAGPLALRRAIETVQGPLAEELRAALAEVDLGARWGDALARAADRVGVPDLRRAVAAMSRTETLGSSLAESMDDLAARVRGSRRAALTERARTAPVKMLFPLVLLVLPAFLLLTVVPVLVSTLRTIE